MSVLLTLSPCKAGGRDMSRYIGTILPMHRRAVLIQLLLSICRSILLKHLNNPHLIIKHCCKIRSEKNL